MGLSPEKALCREVRATPRDAQPASPSLRRGQGTTSLNGKTMYVRLASTPLTSTPEDAGARATGALQPALSAAIDVQQPPPTTRRGSPANKPAPSTSGRAASSAVNP